MLAAVSGGLDSMALLYALTDLGYTVEAAHFDHQTREGQSAEDAAFVRNACALLDVPCHVGTEPVAENARRLSASFEAYARERRYTFLAGVAKERGCVAVATGHQQDDQVETMLLGLFGLASDMGPAGFAPATRLHGISVIHPLMGCDRQTLLAWAKARGISWREDSTNRQPVYRRNRVRLTFMPLLEKPVREHMARFAEMLRSDTAFLDAEAAAQLDTLLRPCAYEPQVTVLDTASFCRLPEAIRRHAVKVLAHRLGIPLSFSRCLRAETFLCTAATGRYFDFGKNTAWYQGRDGAHLLEKGRNARLKPVEEITLNVPGNIVTGGYRIETRFLTSREMGVEAAQAWATDRRQYFDWDQVQQPLGVRAAKPGDAFIPYGMTGKRKVRDVMAECGVPAYLRDTIPLVTAHDAILWVVGYRRGASAPVGSYTRIILEVNWDAVPVFPEVQ